MVSLIYTAKWICYCVLLRVYLSQSKYMDVFIKNAQPSFQEKTEGWKYIMTHSVHI